MRTKIAPTAFVSLVFGAIMYSGQAAFPWPEVGSRSLAALFVLAALTRIFGDAGVVAQRILRYAVAGVALTAAAWFAGGAMLVGNGSLLVLSAIHILAAWMAAAPPKDEAERQRGMLVLFATMTTVSMLAVTALPVSRYVPGSPQIPLVLAMAIMIGSYYVGRGRTGGLAVVALASTITLVLSGRILYEFVVQGGNELLLGRAAPLVAGTAALGTVWPIVAFARQLPKIWKTLAPNASQRARRAYAWITLPTLSAVALALVAVL